mgnify:CR=1 FL=1
MIKKDPFDRKILSVTDLADSGMHKNAIAYDLAKALQTIHREAGSIKHVAQGAGDADAEYRKMSANNVEEWMDRILEMAEKALTQGIDQSISEKYFSKESL